MLYILKSGLFENDTQNNVSEQVNIYKLHTFNNTVLLSQLEKQ